jgi:demethylmenaquinone methyltransferase/2-methoxy-6-polyprenyl-1,4-benzoquinol methylase
VTDLSKTPAKIAGMFDAIAPRYDFLNHFLSGGIDRRWRTRAINALDLKRGEVVLDLCTGTCDLAIAGATRAAVRVVGVDFSQAMLGIGLEKVRRLGFSRRIALARGDAMRLPLPDASVDAVTVAFGIRNVLDPAIACREMRRVLRSGGRLAILEFSVPTMPGVRQAYLWYFTHVLPRLGRLVSGHDAAYEYLPASVGAFASPQEFARLLRSAGFAEVTTTPLTLGVTILYLAR